MSGSDKLKYKTCRELAGLTQEQAVYELDIEVVTTLSRYENGHLPVPDEIVHKMAMLYRNKDLITWHLRRRHPLFENYIPYLAEIHNDYEFALRSEFAANKLSETSESIKEYLKNDGMATKAYQAVERGIRGTSENNWLKLFDLFERKIPLHELMENS